ncbi:MAG: flagellar biosynthetic protein FliO [Oscillospiraceae bacterium]|nr:flagellar biosynthetic protein FliO [Oscillospiraceae bacterium]
MPNNAYLTIGLPETVGLILGVLVFIAVLGGFVYLSKRIQKGAAFSGRRIKVLDRMMLTRDSAVLLVQVGARLMAIGTGKGAPSFICEFSPSDFPEFAAKNAAGKEPPGFWGRFFKHMKSGVAGGHPGQADEDASFAEVLRQIAEKDPVPGGQSAGDTGSPVIREEDRRPQTNRFKRSYQNSIENMTRLSEPDRLDRRSRLYGGAEEHARPTPPPAKPAVSEEERTERIDRVLDLISQRQSRMGDKNDTGELE